LKAETPEDFETQWKDIQEAWADQKVWIKYMATEWIPYKERWCCAFQMVSIQKKNIQPFL